MRVPAYSFVLILVVAAAYSKAVVPNVDEFDIMYEIVDSPGSSGRIFLVDDEEYFVSFIHGEYANSDGGMADIVKCEYGYYCIEFEEVPVPVVLFDQDNIEIRGNLRYERRLLSGAVNYRVNIPHEGFVNYMCREGVGITHVTVSGVNGRRTDLVLQSHVGFAAEKSCGHEQ